MKITKSANGEKALTLTKAEYETLCKKYKFIRNADVVRPSPPSSPFSDGPRKPVDNSTVTAPMRDKGNAFLDKGPLTQNIDFWKKKVFQTPDLVLTAPDKFKPQLLAWLAMLGEQQSQYSPDKANALHSAYKQLKQELGVTDEQEDPHIDDLEGRDHELNSVIDSVHDQVAVDNMSKDRDKAQQGVNLFSDPNEFNVRNQRRNMDQRNRYKDEAELLDNRIKKQTTPPAILSKTKPGKTAQLGVQPMAGTAPAAAAPAAPDNAANAQQQQVQQMVSQITQKRVTNPAQMAQMMAGWPPILQQEVMRQVANTPKPAPAGPNAAPAAPAQPVAAASKKTVKTASPFTNFLTSEGSNLRPVVKALTEYASKAVPSLDRLSSFVKTPDNIAFSNAVKQVQATGPKVSSMIDRHMHDADMQSMQSGMKNPANVSNRYTHMPVPTDPGDAIPLKSLERVQPVKNYAKLQELMKKIALADDSQLPAFMQQVEQLYHQTFNTPMPDEMKEQMATSIRSGIPSTDGSPLNAPSDIPRHVDDTAPPVSDNQQDPMDGTSADGYNMDDFPGDDAEDATMPGGDNGFTPEENAQIDAGDEAMMNRLPRSPDYSSQDALDQPDTTTLDGEPLAGSNNDRINQQDNGPSQYHPGGDHPAGPIADDNGEFASRTPGDVDDDDSVSSGDYDQPYKDPSEPEYIGEPKPGEVARSTKIDNNGLIDETGPHAEPYNDPHYIHERQNRKQMTAKNLNPSSGVYRAGTKFANGVDFKTLAKKLKACGNNFDHFDTHPQVEETPEGQRAEDREDAGHEPEVKPIKPAVKKKMVNPVKR